MAGIITNVDSDIQKLRNLKNEIESVKKALKGVDVKVDIDIAANLEGRLRSLTDQYDELAGKIAEVEGKIALSTKNINDSTEKIIKAQQSIMEASKGDNQAAATQVPSVSIAQISSVQAQAKAYEELKDKIDEVLGSRAENIKRLVDEENHIKRLKQQIAELTAKQSKAGLSENEMRRLSDLNNDLLQSKTAVSQLNQVLRNDAKISLSAADSMSRLSQELGRMRMAYRELTDEGKSSPFGQTLKASIEEADKKIKELDASIGNHQRNVGNYANSWNGLNFSIQQLARELPSLAYGPTIFFSAISNNLPMLADEIKRARIEYNEMVKAGQKGVPVWKQVAGSIISWQTALVAGITILTMHGDKIIEWVGKLFKGSNAALSAEKAIKKLNESLDFKDLGSELANFQRLVNLYRDLGDNAEEKKRFIEDYKEELEKTGIAVNSVAEADKLLIENSDDYVNAMILRAKATAAMKLASENYGKALEKQAKNASKIEKKRSELTKLQQKDASYTEDVMMIDGTYRTLSRDALIKNVQDDINRLSGYAEEKFAETLLTIMDNNLQGAEDVIDKAGLTTTDEQKAKDAAAKEAEEQLKEKQRLQEEANNIVLNQQKSNQDAEIKLMAEGSAKKIAQLNVEYDRLIQTINENEQKVRAAQSGKLTPEQNAVFTAARGFAKQTRDTGIVAVREEENKEVERLLKEYQSLLEKYKETDKKFANDRAKLMAVGASQGTIAELDSRREEALNEISLEMAQREETFKSWMDSITDSTLEELRKALYFAKKELEIFEKQNPNSKQTVSARATVVVLESEIEKQQKKSTEKGPDEAEKDWKDLYETLKEIESQFKEIGDAIGGTVGEVIGSVGEITALGLSMIENIGTISEMTTQGIDKTASTASQSIQMAERASVILAIIGDAIKIITKIVNLATELHDKKHEQRIEKLQDKVDNLEKSYEKLGDAIEEAYSKSAAKLIEQQNKILEQQKALIQQQMEEEEEKKKTDDEKLKNYQDKIDEINKTLEDNEDKAAEAIYGETVQQAIENLGEAYAEALGKGEDGWGSLKDTAKEMMQKMVKQTIKDVIATSGAIDKIREKLEEFYADDILSLTEQGYIYKMAEDIQKELDRQFGWAEDLFQDDTTTEQNATYGGFETMSEETGSELNGRFTALQMAGEDIRVSMIEQNVSLSEIKGSIANMYPLMEQGRSIVDEIRGMLANSILELQGINENTSANVKELKRLGVMFNKWDGKIMNL